MSRGGIWPIERRFLVAFAEAALGLPDAELHLAAKAVERLDRFLASATPRIRLGFHLGLLLMPPGLFTKLRFPARTLSWRRQLLDRLVVKWTGRAPGFLLDRAAILAAVKSVLAGCYCELDEFWEPIDYSPVPKRLPTRASGEVVVPPTGPDLRPGRSATGQFLHDRALERSRTCPSGSPASARSRSSAPARPGWPPPMPSPPARKRARRAS